MTPPDSDDEPDALRRLRERGGRVRPLDDRQRAVLLARFRQRRAETEPSPRRASTALGLAALGALGALGGLAVVRLQEGGGAGPSVRDTPTASTGPSTDHSARLTATVSPAPASEPAMPMPDARKLSLGGRGEISLERGAIARVPPQAEAGGEGPVQLQLDHGRLSASVGPRRREEPLSIVTPHVSVVVIGTRFSVAVVGDRTEVSVEHGRVRVDRGDRSVFVDGGQALRSDDPRLAAPEPPPTQLGSSAPCADPFDRTRCLRETARGSGLAAENALFALALHERDRRDAPEAALSLLRTYLRRFPRGLLVQDAILTAARILHDQGREDDACALVARHARRLSRVTTSDGLLGECSAALSNRGDAGRVHGHAHAR